MRPFILGMIASLTLSGPLHAQDTSHWPTRSVKIVVPFTPGSLTDVAARALARELTDTLGQPFVVENRLGAGGTIAINAVAKAPADGYTLLFVENSFAIAPAQHKALPYDAAQDLVQIAQLTEVPAVLVASPSFAATDIPALIQRAKAQPGTINFGSGGLGTSSHLAMEAFALQTGIQMTHVPFKGIAAVMPELIAGRIDVAIGSIGAVSAHIQGERMRGMALSSTTRHPLFPDMPTFAEQGYPDYAFMFWFGLMAPTGTPQDVQNQLQTAVFQAAQQPGLIQVFATAGVAPKVTDGAVFSQRVRDEMALWAKVTQEIQTQSQ